MTEDWTVPAWTVMSALVVLLLLGAGLLVAIARTRSRTAAALEAAQAEAAALQAQVDAIERRLAEPAPAPPRADSDYVITHLGEEQRDTDAVPAVPAPLFADLVLRESVVQAASLAAGLRRALAPEMRHKIRFEMRREVKRARKQRRADLRDARRTWEAQQRAGFDAA
ncbi:MAG: hypothetical protein Q8O61_12685 [Nocardioides sp.]|nr:hypothetical protein [Nocardioides sp.]